MPAQDIINLIISNIQEAAITSPEPLNHNLKALAIACATPMAFSKTVEGLRRSKPLRSGSWNS
jgi:hypothetical protein